MYEKVNKMKDEKCNEISRLLYEINGRVADAIEEFYYALYQQENLDLSEVRNQIIQAESKIENVQKLLEEA